MARNIFILLILILNIGCDQVSKEIARSQLEYRQPVEVLGNFFTLIKIENTGAFLSWGETMSGATRWVFMIILPLIILGGGLIVLFWRKHMSNWLTAGICLLVGGGIGNIIDRLLYGSVTDFMLMDFGIFRTGIFNVADMSIMAGLGCILVDAFISMRKPEITA